MRRVLIPNVFSPNHDGVNEFYTIENLPEGSTLEVFNRWGSLVFKQAPYLNNWPGNAPNGNPLADGVYFAILTYTDQTGKLQQKNKRWMWLGKSHLKSKHFFLPATRLPLFLREGAGVSCKTAKQTVHEVR